MKFNFFNKLKKKGVEKETKPLDQNKFWKNTEIKGFEDLKDEILGKDRIKESSGNFLKSEQKENQN